MFKNTDEIKYVIIGGEVVGVAGLATIVHARAGGGDNYVPPPTRTYSGGSSNNVPVYSGGSSGSSYGGGTNSSGGSLLSSVILIVIVAVIAIFLKKFGKLKNNNTTIGGIVGNIFSGLGSSMGSGGVSGGSVDIAAEIAKIKITDPQFNEQVFRDKVEAAFFKLQEGWERQDTSILRPYVSDPVLQRFTNQLADMKSRGEKDILENIVIGHIDITDVRSDSSFNYITTKIDASAADYTVNNEGKIVRGSKNPTGFTEYWTFLRTLGVKTDPNKQLKDNKCPNCGAALEVNATGKCNYCGAIVTSGQFDWVVSEIRQE